MGAPVPRPTMGGPPPPPTAGMLLRLFRGPAGRATAVLIGIRIAYAYNWFDVGPALPNLSSEFGVGPVAWGFLIAAFLVGAALFQIPSGFLARRYGPRSVALGGAGLLAAASIASSLAPDFLSLAALRFLGGAGAGLFFSPAIVLVASLHPEGSQGIPVGIFSSAFSAGAGLGVVGSALLIPLVGWRGSLAVGGLFLLGLALVGSRMVPARPTAPEGPKSPAPRTVPSALRSRSVWGIGIAFIGLEGATLSAGQYFVPFAESVHGWTPALAGAVASLFVFPSVLGGPVGGRIAERYRHRRSQMVVATAFPALLLLLVPYAGLALTVLIAATFAVSYGMVYAMMYVVAPALAGVRSGEVALAIGLFNGIQITGGAAVAQAAAWVLGSYGYPAAWETLGLLTLASLGVLAVVPPIRTPSDGVRAGPTEIPP